MKNVMRIRELRLRTGMTQSQLGAEMGVAQSSVASWETEVVLPKARQLPLLARVLGCTISELYTTPEESDAAGRGGKEDPCQKYI